MNAQYDNDEYAKQIETKFYEFLLNFSEDGSDKKIYIEKAKIIKDNAQRTLEIDFTHLANFNTNLNPIGINGVDLHQAILLDFYKLEPYLCKAVLNLMKQLYNENEENSYYNVSFYNLETTEKIRDLKTNRIGRLMSITGTVTRSSEVRPELIEGAFQCLNCNEIIKGIVQQFKFTEPRMCKNPNCGNRNKWQLIVENSVFSDYQKLRVQENSSEIPPGGMPRSIDIILRNEIVDKVKPGDKCLFNGQLVVVPDIISLLKPGERKEVQIQGESVKRQNQPSLEGVTGLKQLGVREMNYKLLFLANYACSVSDRFDLIDIRKEQSSEDEENIDYNKNMTEEDLQLMMRIAQDHDVYRKLARSIAPSVCGHEEIKKGILLMLFGGVSKKTQEGIPLRGDVNLMIVGDPSTAKSQFLKYVNTFLPRSVYTSGKSTSTAGLTASVQRDPETGELCIEAGALMLADNGICCIDEFDKMDAKDQAAIHEAMEQQTISIAKAGIQATLNARTSVLAAANPLQGRYDKSKSLKFNLDISAPIMSRFDLFFVVLDECNEHTDKILATHILNLHRNMEQAILDDVPYTREELQKYIKYARQIKPHLTKSAAQQVQKEYVNLRINDATQQKTSYRITVRQLESLIRLAEGLARVHCTREITSQHVKEAARLLGNSILRIEKPDVDLSEEPATQDISQSVLDNQQLTIAEEQLRERQQQQRQRKETLKISYEDYQQLSAKVVQYFKQKQTEHEQGVAGEDMVDEESSNVFFQRDIVSDIVEQILEEQMDKIQPEEIASKTLQLSTILHGIIQKLIHQEGILVIQEDAKEFKDRKLQLHPNFDLESV